MTDSHSLLEANDTERQKLLTRLKNLGLTTDDELARMSARSPEEFQRFIDELIATKTRLQDHFRQLITIKDVIEKYLSRLISDMLDGRDVIESLRQGVQIYPSLTFISWLVTEKERDLTEFIKDLDLESNYALPILYRWKYEYKPLNDVWRELERREQGRENSWISAATDYYYNELRQIPQVSIQLRSRTKIVWNAREDIDDIAILARALIKICINALSGLQKHRDVDPDFINRMNEVIREMEETINQLKALPILSSQKASEGSTET